MHNSDAEDNEKKTLKSIQKGKIHYLQINNNNIVDFLNWKNPGNNGMTSLNCGEKMTI